MSTEKVFDRSSGHQITIVHPDTKETKDLALLLKSELSAYRIPKDARKKTGLHKVSDIRDDWLIILCTPESKEDTGVLEEIRKYPVGSAANRVLTLLVSGTPGSSFPEVLLHETLPDGTIVDLEPLAANITALTQRGRKRKLKVEKLRLLAPILGVTFDDLRNRRRIRRRRLILAGAAAGLIAAAVFFGYALNRVHILSVQNEELTARFSEEDAARKEAEEQALAAQQDFARLTAEKAVKELEEGNTETAALLCLELLPENADVEELTAVLSDTADALSAKGYIRLCTSDVYAKHRLETASDTPSSDSERDLYPGNFHPPVPDGLNAVSSYFTLQIYEKEYGIYNGSFKLSDDSSVPCSRVHFPADPEADYYLRDGSGNLIRLEDALFLADQSVIGRIEGNGFARFDIRSGKQMDFFDHPPGRDHDKAEETEWQRSIGHFQYFEGSDVVLGINKTGPLKVFSRSPFVWLKTVEGVGEVTSISGTNLLFGSFTPVKIFQKEPFQFLYSIPPDGSDPDLRGSIDAIDTPNGSFLLNLYRIFDAADGHLLYDLHEISEDLEDYNNKFSSEGYIILEIGDEIWVYDPAANEVRGKISAEAADFFGETDEASGHVSAELLKGYANEIYRFFEDSSPVPDSLEGKISFVRDRLGEVSLSKSERKAYHFEVELSP